MSDISKIEVNSTTYNIKDSTARNDNKFSVISGLNINFTSTVNTYQNDSIKNKNYIDVIFGNTGATVLNRCVRIYGGNTCGCTCTNGKSYGEDVLLSYNSTTGELSYMYNSVWGWSSNVLQIFAIVYQG